MDFVYVGDVARANMLAAQSDVTDEVFNVGTGKQTSLSELCDLLLQLTTRLYGRSIVRRARWRMYKRDGRRLRKRRDCWVSRLNVSLANGLAGT